MSIEANNTADFFYTGGVIRGLVDISESNIGSVTTGLVVAVATINLRDRMIGSRSVQEMLFTIASLAMESFQYASGVLTGVGIRTLYRASMQKGMEGKYWGDGIEIVFAGAMLSCASMEMYRYIYRLSRADDLIK